VIDANDHRVDGVAASPAASTLPLSAIYPFNVCDDNQHIDFPVFAMHRFSAKPYLQRVWADFGNEVGFDDFLPCANCSRSSSTPT
jgi:hypothetical protein